MCLHSYKELEIFLLELFRRAGRAFGPEVVERLLNDMRGFHIVRCRFGIRRVVIVGVELDAAPGRQAVRADLARPALRFVPSGDPDRLRASRACMRDTGRGVNDNDGPD